MFVIFFKTQVTFTMWDNEKPSGKASKLAVAQVCMCVYIYIYIYKYTYIYVYIYIDILQRD